MSDGLERWESIQDGFEAGADTGEGRGRLQGPAASLCQLNGTMTRLR